MAPRKRGGESERVRSRATAGEGDGGACGCAIDKELNRTSRNDRSRTGYRDAQWDTSRDCAEVAAGGHRDARQSASNSAGPSTSRGSVLPIIDQIRCIDRTQSCGLVITSARGIPNGPSARAIRCALETRNRVIARSHVVEDIVVIRAVGKAIECRIDVAK